MYYFLALITGIITAVMILANGRLNGVYDAYIATVIIHLVGLTTISLPLFHKKNRPWKHERLPAYYYCGGAIGVLTTVFNLWSFNIISITAITGLGLFGQTVASLVCDHFGWAGTKKHTFNKLKVIGIFFMLIGIGLILFLDAPPQLEAKPAIMLLGALLAFAAGITVVASRIVNGKLAHEIGVHGSTFYNYVVGFVCSVTIAGFYVRAQSNWQFPTLHPNLLIYTGGLLGVAVVMLSNTIVRKISALSMAALTFIGQVFSGIALDYVISGRLSMGFLLGGVAVIIGLLINTKADSLSTHPQRQNKENGKSS